MGAVAARASVISSRTQPSCLCPQAVSQGSGSLATAEPAQGPGRVARAPAASRSLRASVNAGTARRSPLLPSATATLRCSPSRFARLIGLPANRARNSSSPIRSRGISDGRAASGLHALERRVVRYLALACRRAHFLADVAAEDPVADERAKVCAGLGLRCSIVRYEMQRLLSSS